MTVRKFNEFIKEDSDSNWEQIHPDEMMAPFEHCKCKDKDKEIAKIGNYYYCKKCNKIIYINPSKIEGNN